MSGSDITLLYRQHAARLRQHVCMRLRSSDEAEDVVQSIFLELCRTNALDRVTTNVEAYLIGVANHVVARHLKQKRKRRKAIEREPSRRSDAVQAKAAASQTTVERIVALLRQLPPKARGALKLRLIEQMTAEEAARYLGCSQHTFRQRLHCAVKSMHDLMQNDEMLHRHDTGWEPQAREGKSEKIPKSS
jgi:RNA polymerase sigma factor (sigma-70 family)